MHTNFHTTCHWDLDFGEFNRTITKGNSCTCIATCLGRYKFVYSDTTCTTGAKFLRKKKRKSLHWLMDRS